jgi:urease accessory protein
LRRIAGICLGALAAAAAHPAMAHHVMDNQLPATFAQGLLSGLGHPIIGLDHLAAILAVGCFAALHRKGGVLVVTYIAAMLAGTSIHVGQWAIPGNEILVALTVIVLGGMLVLARAPAPPSRLLIVAAAGVMHGYAMGESIIGAEPTPLLAYFAGLAIVQAGVGIGAMLLVRALALRAESMPLRLAGAAMVLVGVIVLGLEVTAGA